MKLKSILFFNAAVFLFALATILVMLANNDPFATDFQTFAIFYGSFFLTLWSLLTAIFYFAKSRFSTSRLGLSAYWPSARQMFFLSLSLTLLLILKGLKIFDWWAAGSIVVALTLLELFFESKSFKLNKVNQ